MAELRRLIGVYDASGRLVDEVAEWFRARLGGEHCSLCAITHGAFREKPAWRRVCSRWGVPFDLLHLRERDAELERSTDGVVPCVVADTDGGPVVLLVPSDLEACDGDPERFADALDRALHAHGLAVRG